MNIRALLKIQIDIGTKLNKFFPFYITHVLRSLLRCAQT